MAILITTPSDDPDWERRAILKFDTANSIPEGRQIASRDDDAHGQVRLGSRGQTRPLQAFRSSRLPGERSDLDSAHGLEQLGDARCRYVGRVCSASASNTAGTRVTINVTALVQRTVNGEFDTRYTRLLIADAGSDAKESYREFYSSEDSTSSRRPTLTVVLGAGTTTPPPPPPSPSTNTLKVLQWNIAQGYDPQGTRTSIASSRSSSPSVPT